ncbi:AraC family transcriptional regulator [Prosthecomicrobium pneumaticum]|uniref:AraC-like DNA-binding protein n=1 Tax=Prosthecomicrobium pneumaticum TaxID=81895 RepID=A0A7W9CUH7_9HYPH|nr:AraC family transcriptional regulator [Prosthecomicrobium pneumaticum]MBB5751846.1 AraC-like DNA-binding protein [Prosthecomicrobium pneumaticum]
MHDHSSKSFEPKAGDALTEMLRGLRLDGVDYSRYRMAEPWSLAFPAQPAARLYFVSHVGCYLRCGDGPWMALRPGDGILLPHGTAHRLASTPDLPPAEPESCRRAPICGNVYAVDGGAPDAADGSVATLFCAILHFNMDPMHPLMRLMPEVMRTWDLAQYEPALPHLMEAMAREAELDRVGAAGILARLADVLAASLIRTWVERGCGEPTGWLAAVREPDVGRVLAAIHLKPDEDWTVEALAQVMGASRSGFAKRFADVVGETPARYVLGVRMHQARLWLERDRMRVTTVAERLGYESEAAFSRAFKRVVGAPPSRFRAAAEA